MRMRTPPAKAAPPRIIAGRHRGRPLRVPAGLALRPTAGRTREAVFDILAHGLAWPGLDGAAVVDVCAGTGAYGLEALSRGARQATFIDREARALEAIAASAEAFGDAARITLLALDAAALPPPPLAARAPLDLAFIDPPYREAIAAAILVRLRAQGWLKPGAIVVVEAAAGSAPAPLPEGCRVMLARTYGAAQVAFVAVD